MGIWLKVAVVCELIVEKPPFNKEIPGTYLINLPVFSFLPYFSSFTSITPESSESDVTLDKLLPMQNNIRQHCYIAYSHLLKDGLCKMLVVLHIVQHMLHEDRGKDMLNQLQNIVRVESHVCHNSHSDDQKLSNIVRVMVCLHQQRKYQELGDVVSQVKVICSLHEAAKYTKTPWGTFMSLCTKLQSNDHRSVKENEKSCIQEFFKWGDVTMQLPYKQHQKFHSYV